MIKYLLGFAFIFCTTVGTGQSNEYLKSELEAVPGFTFHDIKLSGFKNREHARNVLNAVSFNGSQKKDPNNSYEFIEEGDFVLRSSPGDNLLKDAYILHYRPRFKATEVVLELYKLKFRPLNQGIYRSYGDVPKPKTFEKQGQALADEVKQLATLYASSEKELQGALKKRGQTLAAIKKAEDEGTMANKATPARGPVVRNKNGNTVSSDQYKNRYHSDWTASDYVGALTILGSKGYIKFVKELKSMDLQRLNGHILNFSAETLRKSNLLSAYYCSMKHEESFKQWNRVYPTLNRETFDSYCMALMFIMTLDGTMND